MRKGHTAGKKATAQLKLCSLYTLLWTCSQSSRDLHRPGAIASLETWENPSLTLGIRHAYPVLVVQVRPGNYNCKVDMDYREDGEHQNGERFFKENRMWRQEAVKGQTFERREGRETRNGNRLI